MERLTERLSNGQAAVYGCGSNCKYNYKYCNNHLEDCPTINEIYEKLAAYEDLEEQGLLPRLLCKVGGTIYFRVFGYHNGEYVDFIQHEDITEIYITDDLLHYKTASKGFSNEDIGKTIFLTKEAADEALKQMKGESK